MTNKLLHNRIRNEEQGFTLLEVLVAISILAIGMVVLLEGHAASIRISDSARRMTVASALARDMMTDFELRGFPSLITDKGDFEELYPGMYPGYTWEIEVQESLFWQHVREVYVKVLWWEGASQREMELAHFVAAMTEEEQDIAASESSGAITDVGQMMGAYEDAASGTKGGSMLDGM